MNQDIAQGKWKQLKGKLKAKWAKLTDDDLQLVEGKRDQLLGRIQEMYGVGRDDAHAQLSEIERLENESAAARRS